jgi:hypothetical protein
MQIYHENQVSFFSVHSLLLYWTFSRSPFTFYLTLSSSVLFPFIDLLRSFASSSPSFLVFTYIFCYLDSTFLGTCAGSPIKNAYRVTCHAKVTYDDGKLGTRTIGGHITTDSCDLSSLCASFGKYLKNPRNCRDAFCCRGSTQCSKSRDDKPKSGQSSSVFGGASIMLILSTLLANSFAKWYYWYLRNRKHFLCFYIEL